MTNIAEQTLATIVTNNHFAVPVLEKYHLDFCCKGKRTLADACKEKGISLADVTGELDSVKGTTLSARMPFTEMNAGQLISYILIHHHFYVKQSMPTILQHLQKIVFKHGERYPYMTRVLQLFTTVSDEMRMHMQKEETILFPRIKEIEHQYTAAGSMETPLGFLSAPIAVMEMEHDEAGELLYSIRELTRNYTPPADACTTFKVCMAELKEFEEDLHRHIHLENNLLFPMAEKMLAN